MTKKKTINQVEFIHTAGDYHEHQKKVNEFLKYSGGHVSSSFVGTPNVKKRHEPGHFYTVIEFEIEVDN
ncbi:MAG: hypothetical protein LBC17_00520 [Lactobacillaceae bacterium]|jgi:hypothetical protein|nr:hypothetical protein [Lactobacillaceae bacterium]